MVIIVGAVINSKRKDIAVGDSSAPAGSSSTSSSLPIG
jgi:hypothetical protein